VSRTKRQPNADAQERLKREKNRLRRELAERERHLAEAQKRVADAQKQICDLERQLALRQQNSTTTSKPPSSVDSRVDNVNGVAGAGVDDGAVGNRGIRATRDPWSPLSA
jgi:predicted  nucleic acid-binding Zn-ribbon protein